VEFALSIGDHQAVRRAAEWTIRTQGEESGWSSSDAADSAFATACSLSILLHANAFAEPMQRCIQELVVLQESDGGWPTRPIMRIPLPGDRDPNGEGRWRLLRFGSGLVVEDQNRTFTSAACLAALAGARTAGFG
jgi:hypothetical protein